MLCCLNECVCVIFQTFAYGDLFSTMPFDTEILVLCQHHIHAKFWVSTCGSGGRIGHRFSREVPPWATFNLLGNLFAHLPASFRRRVTVRRPLCLGGPQPQVQLPELFFGLQEKHRTSTKRLEIPSYLRISVGTPSPPPPLWPSHGAPCGIVRGLVRKLFQGCG